jgi:orotidine-5''-phosphate decarboxylase (EC 4.1.1.23)
MKTTPIIVALDYPDEHSAMALVQQLDPSLCRLKVGKQLFTAAGPRWVEQLAKLGFPVFWI